MRRALWALVALACLAAVGRAAAADPAYRLYTRAQVSAAGGSYFAKAPDRIADTSAANSPCGAVPGTGTAGDAITRAIRFEVKAGDTDVAGSGKSRRAEVTLNGVTRVRGQAGRTVASAWWECLPAGFESYAGNAFKLLGQRHLPKGGTQPDVTVDRRQGMTRFGAPGYASNASVPTIRGRWVHIAYRITYAGSSTRFSVWYDGRALVLGKLIANPLAGYAYDWEQHGIYQGAPHAPFAYHLAGWEQYAVDPGWGATLPGEGSSCGGQYGPACPNRAPVMAGFSWTNPVLPGVPEVFTAGASDPDGDPVRFEWDWSHPTAAADGWDFAGNPLVVTYKTVGSKTVYMRACDDRGACAPVVSRTFTAG